MRAALLYGTRMQWLQWKCVAEGARVGTCRLASIKGKGMWKG